PDLFLQFARGRVVDRQVSVVAVAQEDEPPIRAGHPVVRAAARGLDCAELFAVGGAQDPPGAARAVLAAGLEQPRAVARQRSRVDAVVVAAVPDQPLSDEVVRQYRAVAVAAAVAPIRDI